MLHLCLILALTLFCDTIFGLGQQTPLNYYKILKVSCFAGPEEIKKAYRIMARKYHPDKNDSPDAKAKFLKINEARDALLHCNRNPRSSFPLDNQGYLGVIFNCVEIFKDVFSDLRHGGLCFF